MRHTTRYVIRYRYRDQKVHDFRQNKIAFRGALLMCFARLICSLVFNQLTTVNGNVRFGGAVRIPYKLPSEYRMTSRNFPREIYRVVSKSYAKLSIVLSLRHAHANSIDTMKLCMECYLTHLFYSLLVIEILNKSVT